MSEERGKPWTHTCRLGDMFVLTDKPTCEFCGAERERVVAKQEVRQERARERAILRGDDE